MNIPYVRLNASRTWFKNHLNCPHRLDGPAIEYVDGDKTFWINGTHYPRLVKQPDGSYRFASEITNINQPPEDWIKDASEILRLQETSR